MIAALLAALAACAPPDDATGAFEPLHAALYAAQEAPDDDALWDGLAAALDGEALTRAYVEARVGRARMQAEGRRVRVLGVEYGDVVPLPADDDGLPRVDATWWVRGIVWHGDHSHARINGYRAEYTLAPRPQGWRIVAARVRDVGRARSAVDVLQPDGPAPTEGGYMDPLELLQGLTP